MKNIIRELEKYRLENKISQQKLAGELDVAFCTVNRWFKKMNGPNLIQQYHINKLLIAKRRKMQNEGKRECTD